MIEGAIPSLVVLLPLLGALLATAMTGERARWVGLAAVLASAFWSGFLVLRVFRTGPVSESLGGWGAPLGIELYVDGLAALLVGSTAVIWFFSSLYAFRSTAGASRGHFWPLWLAVGAGIQGVFLSSDLFNLYVCMELMGIGSVALVAMAGPSALRAAMRYLLVTLCGSLFYLAGVALLYGEWGILEIRLLAEMVDDGAGGRLALGMMTLGLMLKTALFPLHFWLPSAHANAPAPVSALLSALVVKASFFVWLRLWHDVFGALDAGGLTDLLALLGGAAILWGSLQAMRQKRLKMLVAYSTVAQLGYLFLGLGPAAREGGGAAWEGIAFFMVAHGCAKGAMFLAAGAIASALGSDRIAGISGEAWALRIPLFAFALGGISLMGLPPSGGYIAKWLLLTGAGGTEQIWVVVVFQLGGLLAAGYVFKVLYFAFFRGKDGPDGDSIRVSRTMSLAALGLGATAILLGIATALPLELLAVGAPFGESLAEGLEP